MGTSENGLKAIIISPANKDRNPDISKHWMLLAQVKTPAGAKEQ